MSKVSVEVNELDYILAECDSATSCVLALAIHRATGDRGWNVSGDAVYHNDRGIWCAAPQQFDDLANYADDNLDLPSEEDGEDFLFSFYPKVAFTLDTETGKVTDWREVGDCNMAEIWRERRKLD